MVHEKIVRPEDRPGWAGQFNRSIYSRLWTGGILLLACGAMLACGWPGGLAGGGLTDG